MLCVMWLTTHKSDEQTDTLQLHMMFMQSHMAFWALQLFGQAELNCLSNVTAQLCNHGQMVMPCGDLSLTRCHH